MQTDTTIINQFIQRLCRVELSADALNFIKEQVLFQLQRTYPDSYNWILLSIMVALKHTDFSVILLHQDEYPDVKELVKIIRDELIFHELKIT